MIKSPKQPLLDEQAADGVGRPIFVGPFNTIQINLNSTGGGAGTVKVKGAITGVSSFRHGPPEFADPATPDNDWTYIAFFDEDTATMFAGSTGIVLTGTDDNYKLIVNSENLDWICLEIDGYSAGSISANAEGFGTN
jgi:hypothetical protein